MEEIGHKLMAFRIDEQFLGILHSQLSSALEKLGLPYTLKLEGQAAVEILYYLFSFGFLSSGVDVSTGTPGMQAVGLSTARTTPTASNHQWIQNCARAVLVVSFLSIKWSLLKLQELSTTRMWSIQPPGTLERRTQEFLKVGTIVAKCMSLLSFAVFLSRGDCPDLLYRMTGIGMAKADPAGRLGAGYNSAMLFVEGKKMLWLALLGASAAATIAIDWRVLRYYCYFYVRSVFAMVQSIRQHAQNALTNTVSSAVSARSVGVVSYVQFLFSGGRAAAASSSVQNAPPAISSNNVSSIPIRHSSATNNTNIQRGEGVERPAVCAACQSSSPEMPHMVDCGHIYCYICVQRLMHTAPGANQYDIMHTGVRQGTVTCLACYAVVTKSEPLSAS